MNVHIDKMYISLQKIIKNSYKNNNVKITSIGVGDQIVENMVKRYNLKYVDMIK